MPKGPLYKAAWNGDVKQVKKLLASGIKPDAERDDWWNDTPLFGAAGNGHTNCVVTLIKGKADVNAKDKGNWTPLIGAAWNGHTNCVVALIKGKADVNAKDEDGRDAMSLAKKENNHDIVRVLDQAKADFDGFMMKYMTEEEKHAKAKAEADRLTKAKAEADRLAKAKAEADRLAKAKAEAELRQWFAANGIDIKIVAFAMKEGVTCVKDMAEFAEKDLEDLSKMAGFNMLNRRRLIKVVQELSKPPVPAASSSVGAAAAASDPKTKTKTTTINNTTVFVGDLAARVMDVTGMSAGVGPVTGVHAQPLLPLDEAVKPLEALFGQSPVATAVWFGKEHAQEHLHKCAQARGLSSVGVDDYGLTSDMIAAINLYTQQLLYGTLNKLLRDEDRAKLKPFFPYLKLLLTALDRLPNIKQMVYRGLKANVKADYYLGRKVKWWSFSSCTLDGDILQSNAFCGSQGDRTLFMINCKTGKDVSAYSAYNQEKEVLLPPGRVMKVTGHTPSPGDPSLSIVVLTEETLPSGVNLVS